MLLSLLPARCKKYTSSKMLSLPSHLENCLTRLSALVPSGTWGAMLGSCVLLLATMPLMRAARVCRCLARLPWGWIGYHCASASRMARYRRRLSHIVCLSSLLVAGRFLNPGTIFAGIPDKIIAMILVDIRLIQIHCRTNQPANACSPILPHLP